MLVNRTISAANARRVSLSTSGGVGDSTIVVGTLATEVAVGDVTCVVTTVVGAVVGRVGIVADVARVFVVVAAVVGRVVAAVVGGVVTAVVGRVVAAVVEGVVAAVVGRVVAAVVGRVVAAVVGGVVAAVVGVVVAAVVGGVVAAVVGGVVAAVVGGVVAAAVVVEGNSSSIISISWSILGRLTKYRKTCMASEIPTPGKPLSMLYRIFCSSVNSTSPTKERKIVSALLNPYSYSPLTLATETRGIGTVDIINATISKTAINLFDNFFIGEYSSIK
jgi:MFS family permease